MNTRTITINGQRVVVRVARAEELIDLRHQVLRQGLPREAAIFEGDDAETTLHVGAFCNGTNVGCATFHSNEYGGMPAWQLRGMATHAEMRRGGVGRAMLELGETILQQRSPLTTLWCNARTPAVEFYRRLGWRVVSEEFFIETAGPHFRMMRRL